MKFLLTLSAFLFACIHIQAQKDYSAWITTIYVEGAPIKKLRVPEVELTNDYTKNDILSAQNALDRNYTLMLEGKQTWHGFIDDKCDYIRNWDSTFPLHHYRAEIAAYLKYNDAQELRNRIAMDERYKRKQDSIYTTQLKEGYMWVNADSVWVLSRPDNKAPKIGRIYRLSYVRGYEVEGKDEWVQIQFGDHTGYVLEADLAFDWDEMLLLDEEEAELKRGRYYHFDPTGAYKAKLDKAAAEEERQLRMMNRTPSRQYYKGPRGGCYYINSHGNKQYVDRSYCN